MLKDRPEKGTKRTSTSGRTGRWTAALVGVVCALALWPQPAAADFGDESAAPTINVQQNPDTGVIEVETDIGGLPAHYFSDSTVSQLFEQFPEYQELCAAGCEIDVINDVSSYAVSIPQPDFGGGGYAPTVGPSMPLAPAVSVESLACTAGNVIGFDAVATKSGTVATDYVQLIIEHRPYGDADGEWTRLLTSNGEEVFEIAADDDGGATLAGVEVPAAVGGQTQIRIASRGGRDPVSSGTETINVGDGQNTVVDQPDEGDEIVWGLWGAVPPPVMRPLNPVNPGGGIHTVLGGGGITSGVVPGAWHVFEAAPCPTAEVPVVIGVTPCLHPIVMQQNPTPVYYGRSPDRVRHDTSIYEPMRTVRLRVDFTQGADDGTNPQIVGWEIETAGGYWYATNPDAFNSQYFTVGGSATRITETVNSSDGTVDISLEWVYSSNYANGRSHGWNIAVTPILDSDGYVTAGMRTLATVTEATDFCTPTPDAPTDVPPDPPVLTVECDIFTYRVFDSNGFPQTYRYAIAEVSFDPALPTPPAGFEREAQYRARYSQDLGYFGIVPQTSTATLGDDGLYRFRVTRVTGVTVNLEGRYRHRQNIDGAWSLWSDWGTYSVAQQHTLPTCPTTRPPAPSTPPDPAPVLECPSAQFSGIIGTTWQDQAAADWRREAEYDVEYQDTNGVWRTLTATRDPVTGEHKFEGPATPGDTIDVRIRVRGREREWTGTMWAPWSSWSAWSGWHTHATPTCPAQPPPQPTVVLHCLGTQFNGGLVPWHFHDPDLRESAYEAEWRILGTRCVRAADTDR